MKDQKWEKKNFLDMLQGKKEKNRAFSCYYIHIIKIYKYKINGYFRSILIVKF